MVKRITFFIFWNSFLLQRALAQAGGSEPGVIGSARNPSEDSNAPLGGARNPLGSGIEIINPLKADTFPDLIQMVINWLFVIATPIVALMVLYGGFLIMTGGASEDRYDKGVKAVKWAIYGFIVVLLAQSVTSIINSFLGS